MGMSEEVCVPAYRALRVAVVLALACTAFSGRAWATDPEGERVPDAPFPRSVACFAWGNTLPQAKAICERADGTWIKVPKTTSAAVCTKGAVKLDFPVRGVVLRFCKGKLCEAALMLVDPASSDHPAAARAMTAARELLVGKYGEPVEHVGPGNPDLPLSCRTGAPRQYRDFWRWMNKDTGPAKIGRLLLAYDCGEDGASAASVIYQDIEGIRARIVEHDTKRANF
jgi:hypothetical protein